MTTLPHSLLSRRSWFGLSAFGAVGALSPRWWSGSPNEKLQIACVGVGGMGGSDLRSVASAEHAEIVALCDVDADALARAASGHDTAKTFVDWRKMLDAMHNEIDAVVVSTPDHMHGPIAIAAMQLGKHVYCQKPIAHNLRECRLMTDLASETGVVTQMGTQIHSHAAYRTAVAALRAGVIGKVQEAHLWVGKSWAGPASGRPSETSEVPASLAWDLWLGTAPARPFVEGIYHPGQWRGWLDFGSGTLGDMGCHIFDPVFSGLGLRTPRSVISRGPKHHVETFAGDGDVTYEFEGTERTEDRVTLRWTDGGASREDSKAQLPPGGKLPGAGSFLVGSLGVMVIPHWSMPRFYKDGAVLDVDCQELGGRNHYHEWVDACRGEGTTSTPFAFAGPLTEAVLLGTIAGRFPSKKLTWHSGAMEFDHAAATQLVTREYREGWQV